MKYISLFESYEKTIVFSLKSRPIVKIKVLTQGGKIIAIENPHNMRFPFAIGQMMKRNIEDWACNNNYKIDNNDPCKKDNEKIFGIRKKDIPKGHQLRIMYPSKFTLENLKTFEKFTETSIDD
jgi:hypothetical protein